MFISTSFFFLLFTTIIQCQNISIQFPSFPVNTDIGSCTCDLTPGKCDVSCCCDTDCSTDDQQAFSCNLRQNQYTNSTPVISTVQPSCIKNLSIFYSNSPYIIQKMGELVCVDYARYTGSQYYQQPNVQTSDADTFVQAIDTSYSVSAPFVVSTNVTNYQVGTPILLYPASIYSLPVNLFNSPLCTGSQAITYMNNFTSTCAQSVNSGTCTGVLNPSTYSLCFVQSPSNRNVCINSTLNATSANFANGICSNALQSLTVTIYYQNPTGIINVTAIASVGNPANTTLFQQTFTVLFINFGQSSFSGTGNPGYLQGANIVVGTGNGSAVNTIGVAPFSIIKPLSTGLCGSATTDRIPILFGKNMRSTCQYNVVSPGNDLPALFMPIGSSNLYVAAYSNSDPTNITRDWLPVILCTSVIGSTNPPECRNTNISSASATCYIRLNIQIAYTNIGSIFNPQPVLSAVIFHYQSLATCPSTPTTTFVMESVTFQDISNAPIIEQGQIPAPNTRLPSNFFYPFSASQGMKSTTFSLYLYLLIAVVFILI